MYLPPGVTAKKYEAAVNAHHESAFRISILRLNQEPVSELTVQRIDGQLNFNAGQDAASRVAQLSILDPNHELGFDAEDPDEGALFAHRMLRVEHIITSPLLDEPAAVKCFTGPFMGYSRDGDVLSLEAHGKEMRARTDFAPVRCGKNMRVVDAIERVMRSTGETRFGGLFNTDAVKAKLAKPIVTGRQDKRWPWPVAQRLARGAGLQLYYDGTGRLILRRPPKNVQFRFLTPTSLQTRDHDWTQVYNRVSVKGKKKIRAVVTPADLGMRRHPFSPARLGVNGVPWTRTFTLEDDKIGSRKQAMRAGKQELERLLSQEIGLRFNHVPVWHLDPGDLVRADGERFRFREASIPMNGGEMTVGYTENVRRPK